MKLAHQTNVALAFLAMGALFCSLAIPVMGYAADSSAGSSAELSEGAATSTDEQRPDGETDKAPASGNGASDSSSEASEGEGEASLPASSDVPDSSSQSEETAVADGADAPASQNADQAPAAQEPDVAEDEAADEGLSPIDQLALDNRGTLPDGIYLIKASIGKRLVLDVSAGSKANYANVQLYESNATAAQQWKVVSDAQGYLTITNVNSGNALDVSGGIARNGSNVQQYQPNGSSAQKWVAVREGSGIVLYSALGGSLVLDVQNGSAANSANIQIYETNGSAAQSFVFQEVGGRPERSDECVADGTYILSTGGLSLDVRNAGTSDGTALQGFGANGSAAQSFYISFDKNAGFYTITAVNSGRVLDADNGDPLSGASVSTWGTTTAGSLQRYWAIAENADGTFTIVNAASGNMLSISGTAVGSDAITVTAGDAEADSWTLTKSSIPWSRDELDALAHESSFEGGEFVIKASVGNRMVLDVSGGSSAQSANVQIYTSNGSNAQRWNIEKLDDGYVRIVNKGSGKVLDVAGGSVSNGANVSQYSWNETRAQKWLPVDTGDGTYIFFSALGRALVLDVASAGTSDGTNVDSFTCNGTVAQSFELVTASPDVEPCEDLELDGWYTIASGINNGFVLDVVNGSSTNGANIQLYQPNGTMAQLYKFVWSDGWYHIESGFGTALDVAGGDLIAGANVQQWASDKSNVNQQWSISKQDGGKYQIVNRATGLTLDVSGGNASNGSNIQVYSDNGSNAQRFKFIKQASLMPEGVYEIGSGLSSSRVLDVPSGSTGEGVAVQLYSGNGSPAQKWSISRVGENRYRIQSLASGRYLTVTASGSVVQSSGTGEASVWIPDISKGAYVLRNASNRKVLDVCNGSTQLGAKLQTYDSNGTAAQRFNLNNTDILSNGTYLIHTALSYNKVLDVANGSTSDGANVQIFSSNDTGAQKWNVTKNGDGTYTIVNCESGKALDVKNGYAANGSNVQQYSSNNSAAQHWRVSWDSDAGGYVFSSALNGSYALDVSGAATWDGANVQVYQANGSKAQAFLLSPTTYVPSGPKIMTDKAQGYSSTTNYLILVNTTDNYVGIFTGRRGNWSLYKYWRCSSGALATPTVLGEFIVTGKGYSFGSGYTCYYYTQFYGDYLFHSVKYYQGTFNILDGRLGMNISHGCIRLPIDQAKWIYDNIPYGTKVVTYR